MALSDPLGYLAAPWVLSQQSPLSPQDFARSLKDRGVSLRVEVLRELYRHGDLAPLVEVTDRRVGERIGMPLEIPEHLGSVHRTELRRALAEGRARDLAVVPFRPKMRFGGRRIDEPVGWWNGLIYSHWQLLSAPWIASRMTRLRWTRRGDSRIPRLRPLDEYGLDASAKARRLAKVLTRIEARYLPGIDAGVIQVRGAHHIEEWHAYRDADPPEVIAHELDVAADDLRKWAEDLLFNAHVRSPLGPWAAVVHHGRREMRQKLRGDALIAADQWDAAEMLLQFHEDLTGEPAWPPGDPTSRVRGWHPLADRPRLTQQGARDKTFSDLGISAHPGAVIVAEGETELTMFDLVTEHLGLDVPAGSLRTLCMRGADNKLRLLAVAIAAPLLGEHVQDYYVPLRPITRLVVAVDSDGRWKDDEAAERQRMGMLDAIRAAVRDQGAEIDPEDLSALVVVHRWPAACFEFAHFTDEELADGLAQIHPTCNGLDRDQLISRIAHARASGHDVKAVWKPDWRPEPSKPDLARALWPALRQRIDDAHLDDSAPLPPIVLAALGAQRLAALTLRRTNVIRGHPIADS